MAKDARIVVLLILLAAASAPAAAAPLGLEAPTPLPGLAALAAPAPTLAAEAPPPTPGLGHAPPAPPALGLDLRPDGDLACRADAAAARLRCDLARDPPPPAPQERREPPATPGRTGPGAAASAPGALAEVPHAPAGPAQAALPPEPAGGASPAPPPATGQPDPAAGAPQASGAPWLAAAAAGTAAALGAALYRRLRAGQVQGQRTRAAILDAVRASPGASIAGLARATGLDPDTVRYHVRVLAKFHCVLLHRDGRALRVFENGGRFPAPERARLAGLARPAAARLLAALPPQGASPAELARALGVSRQAVHQQIRRLAGAGLVRVERRGARALALPAGPA